MREKTTMYIDRNITDYLHELNINCTEIANRALKARAIELGYSNILEDIRFHEMKLAALKKHSETQAAYTEHQEQFYNSFLAHLQTRGQEFRNKVTIKGWLMGPANREFSDIIGHPGNLTDEKIIELMARARACRGPRP